MIAFKVDNQIEGTVLGVHSQACNGQNYEWVNVEISGGGKVWIANVNGNSVFTCGQNPDGVINYNVPYVSQNFDTPDNHCGWYSCGPTSTVMATAYFGKLQRKTITISKVKGDVHTNDFGFYVSSKFTAPDGFEFNRGQPDPCGRTAYGAYGHGTEGQIAYAWRLQDFLAHHSLQNKLYGKATLDIVRNALTNGRLVIMSTQLTGAGHVILVKGIEGNNIWTNDPYGCKTYGRYGKLRDGENCKYAWDYVKAKWMIEVWA